MLHTNEFAITNEDAAYLFSNFAKCSNIQELASGTDNKTFLVNDEFTIRIPRTKYASDVMQYEQNVMPNIAINSQIQIPKIIYTGIPSEKYPFSYSIYNFIQGTDAFHSTDCHLKTLAIDLANFIKQLWSFKSPQLKTSFRSNLASQTQSFEKSIHKLDTIIDVKIIQQMFQNVLQNHNNNHIIGTIHSDLLPTNLILQNDKLAGVIDFSYLGTGDLAIDLLPAWSLFDSSSRKIFFQTLEVDQNMIMRSMAWAISIAVIAMPYYANTYPTLCKIGQKILAELC